MHFLLHCYYVHPYSAWTNAVLTYTLVLIRMSNENSDEYLSR